jgi:hypothetical protein
MRWIVHVNGPTTLHGQVGEHMLISISLTCTKIWVKEIIWPTPIGAWWSRTIWETLKLWTKEKTKIKIREFLAVLTLKLSSLANWYRWGHEAAFELWKKWYATNAYGWCAVGRSMHISYVTWYHSLRFISCKLIIHFFLFSFYETQVDHSLL